MHLTPPHPFFFWGVQWLMAGDWRVWSKCTFCWNWYRGGSRNSRSSWNYGHTLCAVLQEQGDDQVWKITFFFTLCMTHACMNEWFCNSCTHDSFPMSNLLYLPCRTVPGVKMKKEYREFIQENKWAHNRAFAWRMWSFCNSILFLIKLVSQIIPYIFTWRYTVFVPPHCRLSCRVPKAIFTDLHAPIFYFLSTWMIGGVEPNVIFGCKLMQAGCIIRSHPAPNPLSELILLHHMNKITHGTG